MSRSAWLIGSSSSEEEGGAGAGAVAALLGTALALALGATLAGVMSLRGLPLFFGAGVVGSAAACSTGSGAPVCSTGSGAVASTTDYGAAVSGGVATVSTSAWSTTGSKTIDIFYTVKTYLSSQQRPWRKEELKWHMHSSHVNQAIVRVFYLEV